MKMCVDKKGTAGALITDLSKAFDCLNHKLLIAKLNSYGFSHDSLNLILNYLTNRKQHTRIDTTLSNWRQIKVGVPQGSILGPFSIYSLMMFFCLLNIPKSPIMRIITLPICVEIMQIMLSKILSTMPIF